MKKKVILLIFLFILICLISFITYSNYIKEKGDTLTGETVTGEITEANLAITITVSGSPSLTIISPENETYITNKSILLNYTATGEDSVWYNINGGDNTTITSAIYFNITEGLHTLYLYANNSEGNTTANVTFTVNLSLFAVLYNEYAGSTRGSSTDFNKSSYEDLQNLSGVILENTDWGKIEFNEVINSTNDSIPSDNLLDLDTNTNISENRTELNSAALPNFNKSATLYLYNLTFSEPRILRDGEVCPDTICTEIDYSGGTLIFNVTQFTIYSAEESPEEPPEEEPTPPGRRAGGVKSFSVNINEISVKLKQGEIETRDVVIRNNVNRQLNITISSQKIGNFILIRDSMITLAPGESKSISIDFIARINDTPDLYLGKIKIKEDGTKEEILVILEIESKDILLDAYVEIPSTSKRVLPGEDLLAEIMIFNLGASRTAREIRIEYKIRDLDGNDIFEEHEIITIETQADFIKRIHIPENTEYGDYILYVRAIYNGEVASASARFEVVKSKVTLGEKIFIAFVILIIAIILFLSEKKKKRLKEKQEKESFKDYKKRLKEKMEKHKK